MKSKFYTLFSSGAIALAITACTSPTPNNSTTNKANVATVTNSSNANAIISNPANSNVINANSAAVNTTPTTPAIVGASSPSALISAYHQATVTKNDAALRKILSAATLRELEPEARADKQTLTDYLTSFSTPPPRPPQVVNERVMGEKALLETKDATTGATSVTVAVRENGEWKLDLTKDTAEKNLQQSTAK
ncbi:MAG: hypothetical protein H7Z37_05590 [Pyrinomonadaceae bacterium]|nr:hypothetical protein [Pyrinomonadaceae bacterium]